jgi:gag-polypeptide of LTR copia-type
LSTAAVNTTATVYTAKEKAAIRRNDNAMYNYTLAFQTEACMGMIYGATTVIWPDGLAWLVAKALNEKYAPKDRIRRVEMKGQLLAVSISKKEDPHKMFEKFHRLSNLFNDGKVKISDEDLMAQVFLVKDYQFFCSKVTMMPIPPSLQALVVYLKLTWRLARF